MTRKPTILAFFDHFFPAVKSGGPVRSSLGFAQTLGNYFEITILTSNYDFGESTPHKGIAANVPVRFENFTVVYLEKVRRKEIIRHWINTAPDFVYLNSFFSFDFSIYPQFIMWKVRSKKTKLIIAPRGELASTALSKKSLKKSCFLSVYQLFLEQKSTRYQASSEYENRDITSVLPKRDVCVAANLRPQSDLLKHSVTGIAKGPGSLRVCLIARIHPIKNILLAINACLKAQGVLQFDIYGFEEDSEYKQACEKMASCSEGRISFCAPLASDKVVGTIGLYHVMFLPTQGENFGHSILESFIAGRPVLISNTTPWRGLSEKKAGFDEPLDEKVFVDRLNSFVMMDQNEYLKWSEGARHQADDFFKRQANISEYEKLFSL